MSHRMGVVLLAAGLAACRPSAHAHTPMAVVPVGTCDTVSTNKGPPPGALVPLQPSSPSVGVVMGTVADRETGAALAGAVIRLVGAQSSRNNNTSDAAGRFSIPDVTPGSYAITVAKTGYLAIGDSIHVSANQAATVHFALPYHSCP